MKPTKAQKEWVRKTIEKWRQGLFLGEWSITARYQDGELCSGAVAECHSSSSYLEADIYIAPKFWKYPEGEREMFICHELAHCHTHRVHHMLSDGLMHSKDEVQFHIEQLTQRITNIAYQQEW